MNLLEVAREFATKAHEGQKRKGLDAPYIVHPIRVAHHAALAGLSEEAVAAAYLHDVVEDCSGGNPRALVESLESRFPGRTVELVVTLTKGRGPLSADAAQVYYGSILSDEEATALKLLDRADNLSDARWVLPAEMTWVRAYMQKTGREFPPLVTATTNLYARQTFEGAFDDLLNRLRWYHELHARPQFTL